MRDVEALEQMLANDQFDAVNYHIGAEQELCLIDYDLRPAMKNMDLLEILDDPCVTTELARFNLEVNLPPTPRGGASLSQMENELITRLTEINRVAHKLGAKIILTGILPTISLSHMVQDTMTPNPRYKLLNDIMYGTKGAAFEMHIRGIDELNVHSDTVLFESCNTSFQVHLQIDPGKVEQEFNWAQAIAGPVLAACTNSPMFFGKRLWRETRIALFHQSTDIRKNQAPLRDERARVDLRDEWLNGGAVELYREIITRHRALLTPKIDEDPLEALERGQIPKLKALSLQNGTVYMWSRLCYGVTNGAPHLRIECRYLPSGPTIVDEVANAAFWLGCMLGRPKELENVKDHMLFDDAKLNFFRAAREGMRAVMKWVNGEEIASKDLITEFMIPIARNGLKKAGFDKADIVKYIGIIEDRVNSGRTGSQWMLDSFTHLKAQVSDEAATLAVTEGIYQRQKKGKPVHEWELMELDESSGWKTSAKFVEQVMSKDLITVQEDEPLELVKNIMLWSNVHHVPVENEMGELVGVVTAEILLEHLFKDNVPLLAKDVMDADPVIVEPGTLTIDALRLMIENECRFLPVVRYNKVLGIFTDHDRLRLAEKALTILDDN